MSGTDIRTGRRDAADRSTASRVAVDALVELLNDEYAPDILARIHEEPKGARTLAEECDASRPTVYRRLNRLREAGVVDEEMRYDEDGHHHKAFRLVADAAELRLAESGFEAELSTSEPSAEAGP